MESNVQQKSSRCVRYVKILVVAVWLCITAWLIRYEAFPEYFTNSIGGYRSLLGNDVMIMDSWMKIMFNDLPIGYSYTSMEMDETDPMHRYLINNQVNMALNMMGDEQNVHVTTSARLDLMYELQDFMFNLSSRGYTMRLRAERSEGDKFDVVIATANTTQKTTINIPADVVLYSPMTEMAMKKLKPGQKMTIKTLDPTTLSTTVVVIEALRKETLVVADREHSVTVLSSEYAGMRIMSWIDDNGVVLRQETPFGWTMEKCTPEEAIASARFGGDSEDILAEMAVKCEGRIRSPRGADKLKLRLHGVPFIKSELQSHRQMVNSIAGEEEVFELTVMADRMPLTPVNADDGAAVDMSAFLAPSTAVQSDHPEIVARARQIIADRNDPVSKATAILDWIYNNVKPQMTISLPSALDVLHTMQGDCNECTYLFVALARAAGLPADINVGLAYHNNAFYYHAWPSVYVGRWWEVDPTPTWGQAGVDATHISLVQGEMTNQVKLLKIIGQLRIQILDEE